MSEFVFLVVFFFSMSSQLPIFELIISKCYSFRTEFKVLMGKIIVISNVFEIFRVSLQNIAD